MTMKYIIIDRELPRHSQLLKDIQGYVISFETLRDATRFMDKECLYKPDFLLEEVKVRGEYDNQR